MQQNFLICMGNAVQPQAKLAGAKIEGLAWQITEVNVQFDLRWHNIAARR